eukprot:CAMPEP_0184502162 /NCGR_PEP_ID=MMETSP0113_2-20130426/49524_1 /TAXON_ID=91329 /ORGANISM="Norrisiella sphaerica, Strain BC52" /LENGTH=142 /DNA_ID=CAMNT_0026891189 /DNA_START=66 /DNA_END=494 /DNA_ORIENTATION=+
MDDGRIAREGDHVIDVQWYNRLEMTGLKCKETDLLPVRTSWGRTRGRTRRGAMEGVRELSCTSDKELTEEVSKRTAEFVLALDANDEGKTPSTNEGIENGGGAGDADVMDADEDFVPDNSEMSEDTGDDLDDEERVTGHDSD